MNRKIRTIAATMLLMSVTFLMEGCFKEPQNQIEFHYKNVFLYKGGEHVLLTRRIIADPPFEGDYLWESSDSTIVSVNNETVHANAKGTATISATLNGVTGTCFINVSEGNDFTVPDEIDLKVGESKEITISSRGGKFNIKGQVNDVYYAESVPVYLSGIVPVCTNEPEDFDQIDQFTPEYKYEGIKLTGKHEGTTSLRIYVDEIGFDKLIPVTVLP